MAYRFGVLALSLVVVYVARNAFAPGRGEQNGVKPRKVEVSGTVRLVGSSPMTRLVISGESREWNVESGEQEKLIHLQQQLVTVRAREYYYDRVFANGSSAGREYYLKNITVINPKR